MALPQAKVPLRLGKLGPRGPERTMTNIESGTGPASRVRCPHCRMLFKGGPTRAVAREDLRMHHDGEDEIQPANTRMLARGGAVSRRAREYEREREAEMGQARRTRKYDRDFDHYYGEGEAGFARGGATRRAREPETADAKQRRVEKLIQGIWARNAALEKARR